MTNIYPDYYKDFACIGSACRHNCCIGWEIDIDRDTFEKYMAQDGKLGERLKNHTSDTPVPHFICGEDGRCPFLNGNNLCDIIIGLGDKSLCRICDAHPRFINEIGDRREHGLGMCCEEVARLILGKREKTRFISDGNDEGDEITILRDELIGIFEDRSLSVDERCDLSLKACSISLPDRPMAQWAEYYLTLERLDGAWESVLESIRRPVPPSVEDSFRLHMKNRECEWEQLLVYLIWRHAVTAADKEDVSYRCAFAVLSYKLLYEGALRIFAETGAFTFEDMTELCRAYSAEVEYSLDNTDAVLDELYFFSYTT